MGRNRGDTQARFLRKEPGHFLLVANCAKEYELQKTFRRRFAQMNADGLGVPVFGEIDLPQREHGQKPSE